MTPEIRTELERLIANSAERREDLLLGGHSKMRWKKRLTIAAGILALFSAGTITSVITDLFGDTGMQIVAALAAGLSGTLSLIVTNYFVDGEILEMMGGASKYLALREDVYRLVIHPNISDEERFNQLTELQHEYTRLDESYSRFFSFALAGQSRRTFFEKYRNPALVRDARRDALEDLHRQIGESPND